MTCNTALLAMVAFALAACAQDADMASPAPSGGGSAGGEGAAANETKPLGFYFGLNANEKDQAGLTVGGKDDSQGVAAGIAQKAVAAQQLAEQGGDVRLFSLARRLLWRPFGMRV